MEYKSPGAQINLVELMDGYFRVYAPIFARLLHDFPKVEKIMTFIGRDEPAAQETHRGMDIPTRRSRRRRRSCCSLW